MIDLSVPQDREQRLVLPGLWIIFDGLNPVQLEEVLLASVVDPDVPESAAEAAFWNTLETTP